MNIKFNVALAFAVFAASAARAEPGRTLNACDHGEIDISDWIRVPKEAASLTFLLPPSFETDPSARPRHGGHQWKSGNRVFGWFNGHGELSSSEGGNAVSATHSECKTTIDGHKVTLITFLEGERYCVSVEFQDLARKSAFKRGPVIIGYGDSVADQRLFIKAIRSAKINK